MATLVDVKIQRVITLELYEDEARYLHELTQNFIRSPDSSDESKQEKEIRASIFDTLSSAMSGDY